jgi:hypothetical protein
MGDGLTNFGNYSGNLSEILPNFLHHCGMRPAERLVTTSISLMFTPAACSSSSARPVRRVVETTSGVR